MSDIEIIEIGDSSDSKRKHHNGREDSHHRKRKRTSSGLIEKSRTMKGTETEFEEFVIDRTVTPQRKLSVKEIEKSEESGSTSQWRKRLESTLLGFQATPEASKSGNNRRKKSCFNCDGEHNVGDCPHPKDWRKIAKRKREAADEGRRRGQYNNQGLTTQRTTKFKPGEISESLRHALGLKKNDIPEHVYRMRRMGFIKGYPPGWLNKAVKSMDFLKFYTSDDEQDAEDTEKGPELDAEKVIWYPGFNGNKKHLNDVEKFKIPPSDVFCDLYEKELQQIHKSKKKADKRRTKNDKKSKPKHKKYASDDDDVIYIENEEDKKKKKECSTPGEEEVVVILNESVTKQVEMGESMFEIIGTPVLEIKRCEPLLEAFAVGIQPFEAREEETGNRGNFRKLMDSLKLIREQNPAAAAEEEQSSEKKKTPKQKRRTKKSYSEGVQN